MLKLPPEFVAVDGRPGWHRTPTGDYSTLEPRALELHKSLPLPTQLVCGLLGDDDGHSIFVIESTSAVDLAREFETGSHNALAGTEAESVRQTCDELARVFTVAPFRPYFVDAAGYKAKFLDRITPKQAQMIEEILTVGLEGYVSEWQGNGPIMATTLIKERGLRLWWD